MAFVKINESILREAMDKRKLLDDSGVKTGYIDLDYMFGGFYRGETYLLAGYPGIGKTSFALNLVEKIGVQDKGNIAYFAFDTGKKRILLNLIQLVAKTDCLADETSEVINSTIGKLMEKGIYIEDDYCMDSDEIIKRCKDLKVPFDLIIVDDLEAPFNLMKKELIKECDFLSNMHILANELNCPVLILSRAELEKKKKKKEKQDTTPDLYNLKNPKIKRYVDNILILHRDDYFDNQSEMRGIVEIIVPQNKSGNRGVVRLVWLPKYLRFSSIDDTNIKTNYVYKNGKTFKRYQLNG